MIKPNLPYSLIKSAIVSCEITPKMEFSLNQFGIKAIKIFGHMNCDLGVKNHPDLYIMHLSERKVFLNVNMCSLGERTNAKFEHVYLENPTVKIKYPDDVLFNAVSLGNNMICCKKYIHPEIMDEAVKIGFSIINVNQGYTKCNICVVDEKSVITEDVGISTTLEKIGFDVLLLQKNCVRLEGYNYGFIGGAGGKIAVDKIAFFGDISKHLEFDRIKQFLYKKNIEPVSLSDEPLTDFGSLLPIL